MTEISLFSFDDYKEILRKRVQVNRGELSRAAEAVNCQKSHLSRVMGTHIHLTSDQAYDLCAHWQLKPAETEYFLLLVECARTGSAKRRKALLAKISELKRNHTDLTSRLKRDSLASTPHENLYYSVWYLSAIHILVSIPEFQTREAISKKLQLPEPVVETALESLQQMGLIKNSDKKWIFASANLHLPNHSPLISLHHNNLRQRAVVASAHKQDSNLHYTAVQSMSLETYNLIREKFLKMIDEVSAVAGPSKEEELVCFNMDFFRH